MKVLKLYHMQGLRLYHHMQHRNQCPGQSPYYGYVQKAYEDRGDRASSSKKMKRPLGLPVVILWVIVGLVILLVLSISLGVGLGVGLGQRAASSTPPASLAQSSGLDQPTTTAANTSSTVPTTTTSTQASTASAAPVTSGTTGVADNSCTSSVPTTYH